MIRQWAKEGHAAMHANVPCLPSGVATFTLTSLIVRGEAAKFFAPYMVRKSQVLSESESTHDDP